MALYQGQIPGFENTHVIKDAIRERWVKVIHKLHYF